MADKDILTPGQGGTVGCLSEEQVNNEEKYLQIDNLLSEFDSEDEKAIARTNLGVPAIDDVYNKTEVNSGINNTVKTSMENHLLDDDPHNILPAVDDLIKDMVKTDGSTPFTAPQSGIDPIQSYHLTTKSFVESLLNAHLSASDPHKVMNLVREALTEYVKISQVYLKNELYTKNDITSLLNSYIRNDGSTAFKRPQIGIDPQTDGHLTTKRYVDNLVQKHLSEVDPHGFISTLNSRLSNYYKKTDTYSKAETYSRQQLDSIINGLVVNAAKSVLESHINAYDPHGTYQAIQNLHYVPRDGSVPFTSPQKGVAAVEDDDLVTLKQIKEILEGTSEIVPNPITEGCSGWTTSGPVQTTVGFIEDNSVLPDHLSCQEVFDMIFYGKAVKITTPEYAAKGSIVKVEMEIKGSLADVQNIELYQGDQVIGNYSPEDFVNGKLTVDSLPLTENPTIFTIRVTYLNGNSLEATSTTAIGNFSFIGLLPKWYTGSNINLQYLNELIINDGTNNIKVASQDTTFVHRYKFDTPTDPKHIFIMVPKEDGKTLYQMSTPSQQFGIDAFDVISDLPLIMEDGTTVVYVVYIYRETITGLNDIEVTFKFDKE